MEKQIKISIDKKKKVYGFLRGNLFDTLVMFVHGLTGDMNEHQFFNGARFFEKKEFSSFRFNLYSWQKDARKLHECTLTTHAFDLDLVIKYFRKKGVKKIFVAGHSYGGKTILMSDKKNFNAVVLWDPSHNLYPAFSDPSSLVYVKNLKGYIESNDTSYGFLIGEKMVKEEKSYPWKEKIKEIKVPIKIICAEKGVLVRGCKLYYKFANKPKSLVIIKGANHCFDEEGAEKKLFQETVDWFDKYNH